MKAKRGRPRKDASNEASATDEVAFSHYEEGEDINSERGWNYKVPDMMKQSGKHLSVQEEEDLIIRSQKGDDEAFAELIKAYEAKVFSVCYGMIRNHDESLDLAQDVFMKAYKYMANFRLGLRFFPWLNKIAHNHCLNHIKKHQRVNMNSIDALEDSEYLQIEDEDLTPEDKAIRDQEKQAIWICMEKLNPNFREILIMKHFHNLSYKEISEALNIPIGTVMSRLFNARNSLGSLMRDNFPELTENRIEIGAYAWREPKKKT